MFSVRPPLLPSCLTAYKMNPMKKLLLLLLLAATALLAVSCGESDTTADSTTSQPSATSTVAETTTEDPVHYVNVSNPVFHTGNDPWVVEHNGEYYYCWSGGVGGTGGVRVNKIRSPRQITEAGNSLVYSAPKGTMYSQEYWAPELHYIDGAWYIYVAADDGKNENHRMYVLKGTSQDPTDPFEFVGKITDPSDKWAIDGTVVTIKGENYFVWSGWEGDQNVAQNIYIAHMSNPWTIDSERTLISSPKWAWETFGDPKVNEGPAALYHGDDVFIAYSASGSWTDSYCIGLLTYLGGDPLDAASWKKPTTAAFRYREGLCYGPGHCSFTTAFDGSIWMIYHGNLEKGSGWGGRSVWIAPVTFKEDGTPDLGKPQKTVSFPIAHKD